MSPVSHRHRDHQPRSVLRRSALGKTPSPRKRGQAQRPGRPRFGLRSTTVPALRRTDWWIRSQRVLPKSEITGARSPCAFSHSAPAIAADLICQAGSSTFRHCCFRPHPADCRMRDRSGYWAWTHADFGRLPMDGLTERNPLPPTATLVTQARLAWRDTDTHLAPGWGNWCLAQSNTICDHGIPSGPSDAPKHYGRPRGTAGKVAQAANFRLRTSSDLPPGWLVAVWPAGVEERRHRRRLGGLHGMRYPLRSRLNHGRRITVAVGSELISG
jgi:hypothetical protein